MAQPVYKLWRGRFTEAWYQLSADEQQSLMAKVEQTLAQAGGKELVICSSGWADEYWQVFGVEEFPSLEAAQHHHQALQTLNWYRYIESTTTLGTALEAPA